MIYVVLYYCYFELFCYVDEGARVSYFIIFIIVCLSWLGFVLGCYISFIIFIVYIFSSLFVNLIYL